MTRMGTAIVRQYRSPTLLMIVVVAISLQGCRDNANVVSDNTVVAAQTSANVTAASGNGQSEWKNSQDANFDTDQFDGNADLANALGEREIPYPVYPNGNHYRVGNENGLNIIVFETVDTFEEVDAYYQTKAGLPRLSAMNDYVRYSMNDGDKDPWETSKPGIVIHEFGSDSEKTAAGANKNSRTNIIMSFD